MNSEALKKEMLNDVFYCHSEIYGIDTMENWKAKFNRFENETLRDEFFSKLKQCEHPFLNNDSLCYKDCVGSYVFINERYPEYCKSRVKPRKEDMIRIVNHVKDRWL